MIQILSRILTRSTNMYGQERPEVEKEGSLVPHMA